MRCKNCDRDGGLKGNRHVKNRRYTCTRSNGTSALEVDFYLPDFSTSSDYSSYSSDSSSSYSSDSGSSYSSYE